MPKSCTVIPERAGMKSAPPVPCAVIVIPANAGIQ